MREKIWARSVRAAANRSCARALIEALQGYAGTLLFVSHNKSFVNRLATQVWEVKDGRLNWQGDTDALKESVVRVHMRSSKPLPPDLSIANALTLQVQGGYATAAVTQWGPEARDDIAKRLHANVEVEPLGLEEIFIELHK